MKDLKPLIAKMHDTFVANQFTRIDQEVYVSEECSELIKECCKMQRHKGITEDLIGECIDVIAAISVLLYPYGVTEDQIREGMAFKYERALRRVSINQEY